MQWLHTGCCHRGSPACSRSNHDCSSSCHPDCCHGRTHGVSSPIRIATLWPRASAKHTDRRNLCGYCHTARARQQKHCRAKTFGYKHMWFLPPLSHMPRALPSRTRRPLYSAAALCAPAASAVAAMQVTAVAASEARIVARSCYSACLDFSGSTAPGWSCGGCCGCSGGAHQQLQWLLQGGPHRPLPPRSTRLL